MEITDVRQLIDTYHAAGRSREDTVEIVSAIPINGEANEAFEYIDLKFRSLPDSNYIAVDKRGNETVDQDRLVADLLSEFHFKTMDDTDEILIYIDGVYQGNGARFIKDQCQKRVGNKSILTEHRINEITGHIIRSTYTKRSSFNSEPYILNLQNGLFDIRTAELKPHTPDYLSTIRIPVAYDCKTDCPTIKRFMSEVHHAGDIPIIQELFGYCLIPDNTLQRAFLNVGDGDNGKSTELNLFRAFLGKENCANISWHLLEVNRFAKSALEGKLANIFADLPSQSLNMTTSFKMLTGGDAIGTEKKFQDPYSFINFARLIFSANKPPRIIDEDSHAFWRRWIIIEFPNQFSGDKKDKRIIEKLTTETELSGLLNWALEGLKRVLKNQDFSYKRSVEDTTEFYLRAAEPVYAFLQDMTEQSSDDYVTKDDLYDFFKGYCEINNIPLLKPNAFGRAIQNQTLLRIRTGRPIIDGKRVMVWEGLKMVENVKDVKVFPSTKSREINNIEVSRGKKP